MKTPFIRAVGMNIGRLRSGREWTQRRLAGETDVDMTTVQRCESARVLPGGLDLLKLSIALRVPTGEVFGGLPRRVADLNGLHPGAVAVGSVESRRPDLQRRERREAMAALGKG